MAVPAVLIVFFAVTASSAVLSDECPKTFPKEMQPMWRCCALKTKPDARLFTNEHQKSCQDYFGSTINSSKTQPTDKCAEECLMMAAGFMGEDKTIYYEKLENQLKNYFLEEFNEAVGKTMKACTGRKPNDRCSSGINTLLLCIEVQMNMNCPANQWRNSDACKKTKALIEKCGEMEVNVPDYEEY